VTQFAQNAGLLRRGQGSAVTLAMAAQCISSGASANKIKRQQEHQQSEIEGKKRSRKQKNLKTQIIIQKNRRKWYPLKHETRAKDLGKGRYVLSLNVKMNQ